MLGGIGFWGRDRAPGPRTEVRNWLGEVMDQLTSKESHGASVSGISEQWGGLIKKKLKKGGRKHWGIYRRWADKKKIGGAPPS